MTPRLAIVMPCYNEQEMLPKTISVITEILDKMIADNQVAADSYVLCVDDGSRDATWDVINSLHEKDSKVKGVLLAHNRGQMPALLAGMHTVTDRCDACVTIDADLQDDPYVIPRMVELFKEGNEIVFGVRSSRETDTWFKRNSALGYYKFLRRLGVESVYNHAEFRLMSHRALKLLGEYGETNLYLRGIVAQIGLKTAVVTYPRKPREAGESKYHLPQLLSLSIDGITSFTAKPMRIIFYLGLILFLISCVVAIWAMINYFAGKTVTGWTSLILSVWFLGSLILISLGILGEYVGKIYIEVKHRPRYAIRQELF